MTKAKDFYDIYIIMNNYINDLNKNTLIKAIERKFKHRNINYDIKYIYEVFEVIKDSVILKELFNNYSKKLNYAKNVKYSDTINAIQEIINIMESELVTI